MYYTTFSAFNSHRPPYSGQTIKVAYDPTNRRGTHKSATNQHNPKTSLRNNKQAEMLRVVEIASSDAKEIQMNTNSTQMVTPTKLYVGHTTPTTPLSVSVVTAMEMLGYKDRRSVLKLVYQGKLKASRPTGRKILIDYDSLVKLVKGEK